MTSLTLHQAGELRVLRALTERFGSSPAVPVGPGDDAAVVSAPDGRVVASTDLLVEGRHFRRNWSSAYDVGRRAAAQNLADIVAMGAAPTALLVGLAAPGDMLLDDALAVADGLADECALVGASVAGGDLVRAPALTLAVTALGDLEGRAPVLRSGARPGDRVVLCGRLGLSAAGLALLSAGLEEPADAVRVYRAPAPPYAAGPQLARAGATAMCDVSDGLLRDLGNIARGSGVVVELSSGDVPVDATVREAAGVLGVDPYEWVLGGGEDHALVACLPADVAVPVDWRVIGAVQAAASDVGEVRASGYEGPRGGWDSFAAP